MVGLYVLTPDLSDYGSITAMSAADRGGPKEVSSSHIGVDKGVTGT